jgi:hypothetical protein
VEALRKPNLDEQNQASGVQPEAFSDHEGYTTIRFQIFDDEGNYLPENTTKVVQLANSYDQEDIKQWVTPDHKLLYFSVRNGAEPKSEKRQRKDVRRGLGASVLKETLPE